MLCLAAVSSQQQGFKDGFAGSGGPGCAQLGGGSRVYFPCAFPVCLAGSAALWALLTLCLSLPFVLQVQRAEIREGPSTDLHHLHLRERGAVGDPALGAQRRQPHPRTPAQGDHPGG